MRKQKLKPIRSVSVKMKVIKALPGGVFEDGSEFNCDSVQHACQAADRLQREFDNDADPCRTYVYKGEDLVPIYAGLADNLEGYNDVR